MIDTSFDNNSYNDIYLSKTLFAPIYVRTSNMVNSNNFFNIFFQLQFQWCPMGCAVYDLQSKSDKPTLDMANSCACEVPVLIREFPIKTES